MAVTNQIFLKDLKQFCLFLMFTQVFLFKVVSLYLLVLENVLVKAMTCTGK